MFSNAYRRYVLGTLTLVYTLNFMDRGLIMLLLQPIKDDLHLSDTQLGFLTGIAFGLFYATLGLPIARWADRGNRVTITAAAIGLWGVTVMLSLAVTNFVQLLLARAAAAVGESGCLPPTYSLVGDYFPDATERTRAMTIYCLASPFAALGSFVLGGSLNEHYGWRLTFFLMGIPALFVALIVKATIMEPRVLLARQGVDRLNVTSGQPTVSDCLRTLWGQRSSRHLAIGLVLLFTLGSGLGPWYAAFMIRSHGMGTAELGLWLGLIFSLGGILGILLGGYIATRWFAQNERGQVCLGALTVVALVPCFALFLFLPDRLYALLALTPLIVVFSLFLGPIYALLQRLVPDAMRATALALVMLFANLVGMGLGPQVVGVLSDMFLPAFGTDSLKYAMLTTSLLAFWSAYHFWVASKTVSQDLRRLVSTRCGKTFMVS